MSEQEPLKLAAKKSLGPLLQFKEECQMKKSSLITGILVALSLAFVPACKKDKKKTDEAPATGDPAGMGKPADSPTDPAAGGATDPAAGGATDPAAGGATPPADPAAGGAADPAAGGAAGDPAAGGDMKDEKKDEAGAGGADEVKKDEAGDTK
ncbi:MAG TPA: hypothetical protein VNO33_01195 [Kofleriaceae bacterium]|nr:hypothetical protein [Kofleriaceae bacterium]